MTSSSPSPFQSFSELSTIGPGMLGGRGDHERAGRRETFGHHRADTVAHPDDQDCGPGEVQFM